MFLVTIISWAFSLFCFWLLFCVVTGFVAATIHNMK